MIDGMKIILERMKTNPEEFVSDIGLISRWENLVQTNYEILTDEERKAFNDAIHELRRQRFTSRVLEVLMEEPVELDPNTYTIKTAGRIPRMGEVPRVDGLTTKQMEELKKVAEGIRNQYPFEPFIGEVK